jgi:Mg-chelatase subunit ChlD
MNDPFTQLSRVDLEVKITALVFGELGPSEAAALQAWMDKHPELSEWQRQLERSLIRVREAIATPGEPAGTALEAPRLAEGRRDQLLQQLRRGRPTQAPEPQTGDEARVIPVRFEPEPELDRTTRAYGAGSLALAAGLVALLGSAAFLFTAGPPLGSSRLGRLASVDSAPTTALAVVTEELAEAARPLAPSDYRFGSNLESEGRGRPKIRGFATNSKSAEATLNLVDGNAPVPPPAAAPLPELKQNLATAPKEWMFQTASHETFGNQVTVLGDQPLVGSAFRSGNDPRELSRGATRVPSRDGRSEVEVLRRRFSAPAAPSAAVVAGRGIAAGVRVETGQDAGEAKEAKGAATRGSTAAIAGAEITTLAPRVDPAPKDVALRFMVPETEARSELRLQRVEDLESHRSPGGLGGGASGDKAESSLRKPLEIDDLKAGLGGAMPPPKPAQERQLAENFGFFAKNRLDAAASDADDAKTRTAAAEDEFGLLKAKVEKSAVVLEDRIDTAGRPEQPVSGPVPQAEIQTEQDAFSTFSMNVTDVSFKLADASLANGTLPEAGTIRSEEFLNAFDYHDPQPSAGAPLGFAWDRARDPFTHGRDLLRLAVKTASSGRETDQALNLVLVLDNSGSMERADRVRILRECLRVLSEKLGSADRISVVAFARTARLWVDALPGDRAGELGDRVGQLAPEGGTNLEDALRAAYETALKHFVVGGGNRVILLTDGAANLGEVRSEVLRQMVVSHRTKGIALDCFGIGWEGYNDEVLEALSRNGDGRYGFVNSPEEASVGFAAQLAGALQVAASDVKVQVEFNPRRVASWRQVGYAKHQLTQEQFRDNTVDAAEIGAAESGNALYVIDTLAGGSGPVATVRVRYREPATGSYSEHAWEVPYTGLALALDQSKPGFRLAAAASLLAESLAGSPYAAEVTSDRLLGLMTGVPAAFAPDPRPGRLEWMIRQAKSLRGR